MPTANDYRLAASLIEQQADTSRPLIGVHLGLQFNPGVTGGTIGPTAREAVAVCQGDVSRLVIALAELAAELHQRAQRCAEYTQAMRDWEAQHRVWTVQREARAARAADGTDDGYVAPLGPEPQPPAPPFPEAEVG